MRKLLSIIAASALMFSVSPVHAVPGLDEDPVAVEIVFEPFSSPEPAFFNVGPIDSADFEGGDRQKYDCAFIELIGDNQVDAIVTFERVGVNQEDGQQYLGINDRGISETSDGHPEGPGAIDVGDLCGEPNTTFVGPKGQIETVKGLAVFDGTDHFPHAIHPGDGIQFYQLGVPTSFLDLSTTECDPWYMVPGDEAGEFWLYEDIDGPTDSHHPGVPDLPCNGGPEEPIAMARVYVDFAREGVGYCTMTFHETMCAGVTEPTPTPAPTPSPSPSPSPACNINPKTGQCIIPKGGV